MMALSNGLNASASFSHAKFGEQGVSTPIDSPKGSFVGAPTSPLEMSRADSSKVTKLLRFDLKPSFVVGGEPSSGAYTVSVKNTFLDSFEDSDSDLDLPPRSASAPSMPILKNKVVSPIAGRMAGSSPEHGSNCLAEGCMPGSLPEHRSNCPAEGSDCQSDVMLLDQAVEAAPTLPGIALVRSNSSSSLASSRMSSHGSTAAHSASSLDSSVAFKVRNTFIHVDVDVDLEGDISLPVKSVSQPDLSSLEDSRYPGTSPVVDAPSVGSASHSAGQCRPCAWFWKPQSCQWGSECMHCHLCPMGELRRRKKEMQAKAKELKRAAKELAQAAYLENECASLETPAQ